MAETTKVQQQQRQEEEEREVVDYPSKRLKSASIADKNEEKSENVAVVDDDDDSCEDSWSLFPDFPVHDSMSLTSDDEGYVPGENRPTPDQVNRYKEELKKSDGYDLTSVPHTRLPGLIQPFPKYKWSDESTVKMNDYSKFALDYYNDREGTCYEFVEAINCSVSLQPCGYFYYYLTFIVTDSSNPDAGVTTFQARVVSPPVRWNDLIVEECRIKPSQ